MKDTCLFFIILASLIFVGTLNAQTPKWVSTEVQNYTAVLEHFTSIYSGNCADGHRISNELVKKYKDKLIIINNYCDTEFVQILKPYYPDLTTAEGYTIYSHAGEKGELPGINTGSINRSTGPWAIIPDKWQNTIEYILNKKSIVNVYIKPTLNEINRELTVEIEYFYTDDAPVYIKDGNAPDPLTAKNYLTVMLLQNEIVGYQKDGKRLNPEYALNDTLYRHMHVLRKIISDGDAGGDSDGDTWSPSDGNAWGDLITNTKKGNYGYRKYTIILPDSINNVPLDLANLEVVAFISAKGSYIYSGHKAAVEISKDVKTDLAVEDITEYHNTLKFENIHPKFKITNNSDVPVTKFDIQYTLLNSKSTLDIQNIYYVSILQKYDTLAIKTDNYSGLINKGESVILEFPEITRANLKNVHNYIIQSFISNIYNNDAVIFDINKTNNSTETSKLFLIDTSFSETEITFENSDTSSKAGLLPVQTTIDNSINPFFTIYNGTCGAKNTESAVFFPLNASSNVAFKPGYIILGEADCQDNPNKILSYYYAYSDGRRNGTRPRIIVEISKDWGKTWEKISEMFCDETGQLSGTTEIYFPKTNEYKQVQINLSEYVKENFIVRIGGIPGSNGNALWIDEISIANGSYDESIEDDINISLYPNPVSNILYIKNSNLLGEKYKIYDMSGKMIIKGVNNSNDINVETLSTGYYSLKIKDSIFKFIKK